MANKKYNEDKLEKIFELFRYGIVGICTTIINIYVYKFCAHTIGIYYLYANMIAWSVAVIFAFFTNKFIVFRNMNTELKILKKEFISFVCSRGFTGILDMIFMYIFISILNFNDFFVKVFVNVFIIILNYILGKFFVFRDIT